MPNGSSINTRLRIEDWYRTPKEKRVSQTTLRQDLHISYPRFAQIVQDIKLAESTKANKGLNLAETRKVMEYALCGGEEISQDVKETAVERYTNDIERLYKAPDDMKKVIVLKLLQRVMEKADHNAAFRIAQMLGWIVEKKEEKIEIGLTPDEVSRRNLEAEKELDGWRDDRGRGGQRVAKV